MNANAPRTDGALDGIVFPLLVWFREHARSLPWRSDPQPYRVWVSEIMLQQTRVAAVLGYFARFTERLPTVRDLAEVDEEELLKLWQGLGYYNRARNLQKAARQIMERFGGVFPDRYEDILTLAGVGEYTAGAIASIAFGRAVPAVDGNVLRVICRVTGDERPIDALETKRAVREALAAVIPLDFPGQFNQALMELGALVCLPNGAPLCEQCPLAGQCRAFQEGRTGQLPTKLPKRARRVAAGTVYLLFSRGRVALRKRASRGLLAGLWEYPHTLEGDDPAAWGLPLERAHPAGRGKHIFTHIEWQMEGRALELGADAVLPDGWVWADRAALHGTYAVPNAFSAFRAEVEARLSGGPMGGTDG